MINPEKGIALKLHLLLGFNPKKGSPPRLIGAMDDIDFITGEADLIEKGAELKNRGRYQIARIVAVEIPLEGLCEALQAPGDSDIDHALLFDLLCFLDPRFYMGATDEEVLECVPSLEALPEEDYKRFMHLAQMHGYITRLPPVRGDRPGMKWFSEQAMRQRWTIGLDR
jgi:hypothetical protein